MSHGNICHQDAPTLFLLQLHETNRQQQILLRSILFPPEPYAHGHTTFYFASVSSFTIKLLSSQLIMRITTLPCRRLSTIPLLRVPPKSIFTIRHGLSRPSCRPPYTTCSKSFPNQPIRWPWLNRNYALCISSASLALALHLALSPPLTLDARVASPEKTTEQLMLEESERERLALRKPSPDQPLILRILKRARLLVIECIIEPIATGLRFVHLVVIFVPVILAIPLACAGPRRPDRSNERIGTIWWYSFLIKSMERAGPTFIKVGPLLDSLIRAPCISLTVPQALVTNLDSWGNGQRLGPTFFLLRCVR